MAEAAAQQEDAELDTSAADSGAADGDAGAQDDGAGEAKPNPEAEKVARLMGWKPAEDWEGDKSKCLSAEDFLAKQPEILRNTRRKADQAHDKLNRVVAEVAKLSKNQRQQIDAELEAQLTDAVAAGDTKGALAIMDQIKKVAAPSSSDEVPAFDSFKERNTWYGTNKAATAFVHALDGEYNADGSGAKNPEAHFRKIEAAVKAEFPKLFEAADGKDTTPGQRAPLVNRGGRIGGQRSNGELTAADMTSAMKKAADEMNVKHTDWLKEYNRINAREKASA